LTSENSLDWRSFVATRVPTHRWEGPKEEEGHNPIKQVVGCPLPPLDARSPLGSQTRSNSFESTVTHNPVRKGVPFPPFRFVIWTVLSLHNRLRSALHHYTNRRWEEDREDARFVCVERSRMTAFPAKKQKKHMVIPTPYASKHTEMHRRIHTRRRSAVCVQQCSFEPRFQ